MSLSNWLTTVFQPISSINSASWLIILIGIHIHQLSCKSQDFVQMLFTVVSTLWISPAAIDVGSKMMLTWWNIRHISILCKIPSLQKKLRLTSVIALPSMAPIKLWGHVRNVFGKGCLWRLQLGINNTHCSANTAFLMARKLLGSPQGAAQVPGLIK